MKLKTRTNQPVYYKLPVSSNMQSLSDDLLNSLRVGDVVQKKTGNQKHCYIVTYKEEKHGICLSYFACGYLETIAYDYTNGHLVYNSTDVCNIEDALANVKGFSGDVIVTTGPSDYIKSSDLPTSNGIYRLKVGNDYRGIFVCVITGQGFVGSGFYRGLAFSTGASIVNSSNNFTINNYNSQATKMYRHSVDLYDGTTKIGTFKVITPYSESFNDKDVQTICNDTKLNGCLWGYVVSGSFTSASCYFAPMKIVYFDDTGVQSIPGNVYGYTFKNDNVTLL